MRLNILLIGLILITGILSAQSLERELIQVSLEFQIAFQLVREGQAGLNLELIGLQNELIDWQGKEEKWKLDENELKNELQGSKQQAKKLRQDLSLAKKQTSGLEISFGDYKKEVTSRRKWLKFCNRILIVVVIGEAFALLLRK